MDCPRRIELLGYLLEPRPDRGLASHLEGCDPCRADADLLGRVAAAMSAAAGTPRAAGDCLQEAELAALAAGQGELAARAHLQSCPVCNELVQLVCDDLRVGAEGEPGATAALAAQVLPVLGARRLEGALAPRRGTATSLAAGFLVMALVAGLGWFARGSAPAPPSPASPSPAAPTAVVDPVVPATAIAELDEARAALAAADTERANLQAELDSIAARADALATELEGAQARAATEATLRAVAEGRSGELAAELGAAQEDLARRRAERGQLLRGDAERTAGLEARIRDLDQELATALAAKPGAGATAGPVMAASSRQPALAADFAMIRDGSADEAQQARARLDAAGLGILAQYHEAFGEDKQRKAAAQKLLREVRRDEAAYTLVTGLGNKSAVVRRLCHRYLEATTRCNLPFDAYAEAEQRADAIAGIREWVRRKYLDEDDRGTGEDGRPGGGGGRR